MPLFIEGSEANINKNNSYAVINGKEYFSKDITVDKYAGTGTEMYSI